MVRIIGFSTVVIIMFLGCADKPAASSPSSASGLSNTAALSNKHTDEDTSVKRPCLTRSDRASNESVQVRMKPGISLPSLCLQEFNDDRKVSRETCWRVDSDGLVARLSALPALGDLQPAPGDSSAWSIDSPDGRYRAVIGETHVDIHNIAANKRISHIPRWSDESQDGVSASVGGGYFVGDTVFLIDHDAGPHSDVIGFRVGGDQPGTVADEVYNGSISILDEHRLAFAGPALTEITVYDTRTHERTKYNRTVPRSDACTEERLDNYLLEGDYECGADAPEGPNASCCRHMEKTLGRYMNVELGALPDGRFLAALNGVHTGDIAIFDPTKQAFTQVISILCKR